MPFRPDVHDTLIINGIQYRVAPHPHSPNFPFAQEGGRATVYRIDSAYGARALKVFKQLFRTPHVHTTASHLRQYATLTGLGVCNRDVLAPAADGTPPLSEPDLTWAVLMPWVEGSTWYDVLVETDDHKRAIDGATMRVLVQKFLNILLEMELNAVTHCDLSPGNILVRFTPPEVDLIDVEELCAAGVPIPEILPKGTPGYTHRSASDGQWHPYADRFAGAILLCEMMCWSDDYFRSQVHGDSFFDPAELQNNTPRFHVMYRTLTHVAGAEVAKLFERCWFATNLSDAPGFWEWARAMPYYLHKTVSIQQPLQSKEQTQLTHAIQQIRARLRHPDVLRDAPTRAAYQRLLKRLETDFAKVSNGATLPSRPKSPVRTTALPKPAFSEQLGGVVRTLNSRNGRLISLLVSVVVSLIVVWGMASPYVFAPVVRTVAAGSEYSLAVTEHGSVLAWGNDAYGQTNIPASANDVVAIAAGTHHVLAVTRSGEVLAWGWNGHGQTDIPATVHDVVAVAAGDGHSLALTRAGKVLAWGWNGYGQAQVPAGLNDVVAIAAGDGHSLALTRAGNIVAWGWDGYGQTEIPSGLHNVVAIAAGSVHSLAATSSGNVVAWGGNSAGQTTVPAGVHDVVAVAAGFAHSLALTRSGDVIAWGKNTGGQANVPGDLHDVVAISAGYAHSLTVTANGRVVAWGLNDHGQTRVP